MPQPSIEGRVFSVYVHLSKLDLRTTVMARGGGGVLAMVEVSVLRAGDLPHFQIVRRVRETTDTGVLESSLYQY